MKSHELTLKMLEMHVLTENQAALLLIEEMKREIENLLNIKCELNMLAFPSQETRPLDVDVYEEIEALKSILRKL